MPRRVIPCSIGVVGLLLVTLALALPDDFGSRGKADPAVEPATAYDKLIASECPFFITFRLSDLAKDDLVSAIIRDMPTQIESETRTVQYGIDRVTLAQHRLGEIIIIRTKKPYDADKMRTAHTESRGKRFKDKGGEPEKPVINEKKIGSNKIYYTDEISRWTRGYCPIDKNTFMIGQVAALEALLRTKNPPSPGLTEALALASNHSLVFAMDGKRLAVMVKQAREEREKERREWEKKREERFKDKDGFKDKKAGVRRDNVSRGEVLVSTPGQAVQKADKKPKPADEGDDLDHLFDDMWASMIMLPFKPLFAARTTILTLDIKKKYTLVGKVQFNGKDGVDDGETAMKLLLYTAGQLAVMMPKQGYEFRGMQALSAPLQKAFKEGKLERKDNTITATVVLEPEADLAKKVRDGIETERRDRFKDRKR